MYSKGLSKRIRRYRIFFILIIAILILNFYLAANLFVGEVSIIEEGASKHEAAAAEAGNEPNSVRFSGQCNASINPFWKTWDEFDARSYIEATAVEGNADAFARHQFDQRTSDSIPPGRDIPDTRHGFCEHLTSATLLKENGKLPSVSVIITFHNEARSTLLRTVVSLLRRTESTLLCEVILVDDFSDSPADGEGLAQLQFVRVLRNTNREGLVRSRNRGAQAAHGEILVFLDSHCETNQGWLEALLQPLLRDARSVVSPVIDVIDQRTFTYRGTDSSLRGGFGWDLVFKWEPLPGAAMARHRGFPAEPFATPMFAGGLFAISKAYFFALGAYDNSMAVWGGENIEMSLRVWQCGGQLLIAPCSRVGHVFRDAHPYVFPDGGSAIIFARNTKRAAQAWLDEYSELFYEFNPLARAVDAGEMKDRLDLRAKLQCKPFSWFLRTVYPELKPPAYFATRPNTVTVHAQGGALSQGAFCINLPLQSGRDAWTPERVLRDIRITSCDLDERNLFEYNDQAQALRHVMSNGAGCLAVSEPVTDHAPIWFSACDGRETQKWIRTPAPRERDTFIFQWKSNTGLCLASHGDHAGPPRLSVEQCNPMQFTQRWKFRIKASQ